ncbi:MAG: LssY C-terminal domain-containing protein [Propionibacteriaceae bacterium]
MAEYDIPQTPPIYHAKKSEVKLNKKRIYRFLDSFFAGYGLVLTFWFAGILLLSTLEFTWQSIIFLIGFWLVLTYFALPRMHYMFTRLYLPEYFIARTKTGDGLLGDPVNLALIGEEEDIHAAMRRANWVQADEITLGSALGIIRSSLTRKSYPAAPVSDLFLFGRRHDFAYQQEVLGNASRRHHVRFWKVPEGWRLPGGQAVEWLAAGTYDRSVGLSSMTMQITHKIDADIDAERDYIIDTVRYQDPDCSVAVIQNFSTAFHDRNGGGDAVMTDGNMPVLAVTNAKRRAIEAGVIVTYDQTTPVAANNNFLAQEIPPKAFSFVALFLVAQLAIAVVKLIVDRKPILLNGEFVSEITLAIGTIITCLVFLLLLFLTVRKYRWPRLIFLVASAISATVELAAISVGDNIDFGTYIEAGISLLLVLVFSSPSVREWVFTVKRRSGHLPVGF